MCVWVNWPAPVPSPQLAHTVTEMAATASHRVASNIVAVTTHSPAGVHHYTAGAVLPHPVNPVAPGSAIAPIACICLLSLTTVGMTVLGFTVLDVAEVTQIPVETGPNFAEVEEQACRLRTACKVQQAVVTGAPHTLEQGAQLPHHRLFTHAVVPVEVPPSTEMLPVLSSPPVCPTDPPWLESPRPPWRPRPRPGVRVLELCEVKKVNNPKKQEERGKNCQSLPVCKSVSLENVLLSKSAFCM